MHDQSVNQRNASALHEALQVERRRVDDAHVKIVGLENAMATLRAEVETMRRLVLVQRGTGPSVVSAP